jgi:coenzyme F420-0:L-glutamate ligase/coenzyme F420-1:gamma-L-glutamate ligase
LELTALPDIPLIKPGYDLARIISTALDAISLIPEDGDMFVVSQKIVSKAEGRQINLQTVLPSQRAQELAQIVGRDARHIEVMLQQSEDVLRVLHGALITVHKLGFVIANAGVDLSNIDHNGENDGEVLLFARGSRS